MEYNHKCIKCSADYKDNDPEAYYCVSCLEESKAIAKQVDSKRPIQSREKTKSALEIYDELRKANNGKFVNIRDLGIKL